MKLIYAGLGVACLTGAAIAKDDLWNYNDYNNVLEYFVNYLKVYNSPNTVRFHKAEARALYFDMNSNEHFTGDNKPKCDDDKDLTYRRADGKCNNLRYPTTGGQGSVFRQMRYTRQNGKQNSVDRLTTPEPDEVKTLLVTDTVENPNYKREMSHALNQVTCIWLQFMVHDWMNIAKNFVDFDKSPVKGTSGAAKYQAPEILYQPGTGDDEDRYVSNNVTHWWDTSMIYGSDQATVDLIRKDKTNGEIRVGTDSLERQADHPALMVTGFNDNIWTGLEWMHVLWHKEHNYVVGELHKKFPKKTSDELFNIGRNLISNVINKIHAVEWTPVLFNNARSTAAQRALWGRYECKNHYRSLFESDSRALCVVIDIMRRNNEDDPWGWTNSFISVYRIHFLLGDDLTIEKADSSDASLPSPITFTLQEMLTDSTVAKGDGDKNLGGGSIFTKYTHAKVGDGLLKAPLGIPALGSYPSGLTLAGGFKHEMPAIEIYRDRQMGTARYADWLEAINLPRPTSWEDIYPSKTDDQKAMQNKLKAVYGDDGIDDVDVLIGLTAQRAFKNLPGHVVVDPAYFVFALQTPMRSYRDKFFVELRREKYLTDWGMNYMDFTTFSHILKRHGHSAQENALTLSSTKYQNPFLGQIGKENAIKTDTVVNADLTITEVAKPDA